MKQLLFGNRTDESLFNEIKAYADEGNGAREAMQSYYDNAEDIGNEMETDRNINLMCTAIRISHNVQLLSHLDDDYFLVVNNEEFEEC